jgi:nucleotide-binding universal stress UspA family protein
MNVRTILVPLDGSPLAELALSPAVKLARANDAKVVLLRAAEAYTTVTDPAEAQVGVLREAENYLAGVRSRLLDGGMSVIETSVWYGPPAEAIVEAARHHAVDLLVMSSHGRSGLGRLLLGSVAESVLRATRTPILLIRAVFAPIDVPSSPVASELPLAGVI